MGEPHTMLPSTRAATSGSPMTRRLRELWANSIRARGKSPTTSCRIPPTPRKARMLWFSTGRETSGLPTAPKAVRQNSIRKPESLCAFRGPSDFLTLDPKGNVWSPHREGAFKLDPVSGKYTNYAAGPGKANYDLAADKEG